MIFFLKEFKKFKKVFEQIFGIPFYLPWHNLQQNIMKLSHRFIKII